MINVVLNKVLDMFNIVIRYFDWWMRGFWFDFYLIFVLLRLFFNEFMFKMLVDVNVILFFLNINWNM